MLSCHPFFFLFLQSFLARLLHHSQTLTASHTRTHSTQPVFMSRIILSSHSSNMYPAEYSGSPPRPTHLSSKLIKLTSIVSMRGDGTVPPPLLN